ncbi:MAG TPA: (2Fe-2S)-binding protein [Prolixibacteraceae bacterium]|nr:(2Fe-2S)-binding protein [Prolixibacteraceae bacterium]
MNKLNFSDLKMVNPDKMICYCKQVTQKEIEKAIKLGAKMLSDIQLSTGACTGNQCKELNPSGKCCSGDIRRILKNDGLELIKPSCCS